MSLLSTNHVKYGSTTKAAVVNKNFSFGVQGADDYGPSYITEFYNCVPPPVGGYSVYSASAGQIYMKAAHSDQECIDILKELGCTETNIADALTWVDGQNDIVVRSTEYQLSDVMNSFTIQLNDFGGYWTGWGVTASNANGFSNSAPSNLIDNTYIPNSPNTDILTRAANAATNAGMNYNTYAYVWNVTWADNSTSLCRVGIVQGGHIVLSPIDQTDTRWQSGDTNNRSLAGTFNFPATFTPYSPLTTIGNYDSWC